MFSNTLPEQLGPENLFGKNYESFLGHEKIHHLFLESKNAVVKRCCVSSVRSRKVAECSIQPLNTHMQRHPESKGRVSFAVNRLDCAVYEQYFWLTYKAIDSRYLERPTLASRVPLILLSHFSNNECEISDFCL